MTGTDEILKERYALAYERLKEIRTEKAAPEPYRSFFSKEARFMTRLFEKHEELYNERMCGSAGENAAPEGIEAFYEEMLPGAYESSFGNPAYAVSTLGEGYGRLFSWLCAEMTGAAAFAFGNRTEDLTVAAELFLGIYNGFIYEEMITEEQLLNTIYSYNFDYCADFTGQYIDGLAGVSGRTDVPGRLPARSIDLCMPLAGVYEDGGKYAGYLRDHKYDCGLYLDDRLVTARLQAIRNTLKSAKNTAVRERLAGILADGRRADAAMSDAGSCLNGKSRKLLEKYAEGSCQIIERFVKGGEV